MRSPPPSFRGYSSCPAARYGHWAFGDAQNLPVRLQDGFQKTPSKLLSPNRPNSTPGNSWINPDSHVWNSLVDVYIKCWSSKYAYGLWVSVDGVDLAVHFNCQILCSGQWGASRLLLEHQGLRQGNPLSSYLFVLGMEVLSALIRRAADGGFISGCRFRGRGRMEINVVSGLRINLAKSKLVPVGAHHKAPSMWDGMEKRMRRRLALWKRQYISKGGRITLIKSTLEKGGLGIRKIVLLNKALLGKWIWRFSIEKDNLWKKEILKKANWCWDNIEFKVGKGTKVKFWTDHWCGNAALSQNFPQLFTLAVHRNATVNEVWDSSFGQGGWNLKFSRDFNDWELDLIGDLLNMLRDFRISSEGDSVFWKGGGSGIFGVKDAYNLLVAPNDFAFLKKVLWEIVLALFGVQWVFLETVKEGVYWRGVLFALRLFGVANVHLRAGELIWTVNKAPSAQIGLDENCIVSCLHMMCICICEQEKWEKRKKNGSEGKNIKLCLLPSGKGIGACLRSSGTQSSTVLPMLANLNIKLCKVVSIRLEL
ncbi:hypothetical protein CK203_018079 [Vitis vinifera]|uniref:Uncharacterized protein n=1 Tax=Vitis vinifera TaxID=29760 RepID=A0A438JWG5_VITVI|nr:hypothetical protein CK203_018079 [Vitis vinifera]